MRFFKEIWTFIQLFFTGMDKSKTELEPWGVKYILSGKYKYMCWCGRVLFHLEKPEEGILVGEDKNHETLHLIQAHDSGSWIKYYWGYLIEWLKGGGPFSKKSYYVGKYEVEAYAKEGDDTYISRRPAGNVDKFILKDKTQEWKNGRKSSYFFKLYIKEKFKDI